MKVEHYFMGLTSGSGHIGSLSLSISAGFMTSILTSCVTLTFRPPMVCPLISKLNTARSFFFASFTTTSSASYVDGEAADLSAARRASEERETDISFDALDWIR